VLTSHPAQIRGAASEGSPLSRGLKSWEGRHRQWAMAIQAGGGERRWPAEQREIMFKLGSVVRAVFSKIDTGGLLRPDSAVSGAFDRIIPKSRCDQAVDPRLTSLSLMSLASGRT
jgi:hypothetical protein